MVEQTVQQPDGGSTPAPPLQVSVCPQVEIQPFLEKQHYSHSVFEITAEFCFKVCDNEKVVGGAIFGKPAGMGVLKKYSDSGKFRTTELRRFALADACPRNSESRLLAVMFRNLRKRGVQRILSYADPAAGHSGVIYKALGFEYLGTTAKRKHVLWKGKKYPDRNIHQIHFPYHTELRAALANGDALRFEIPGKHIYLLTFPY